MKKHNVRYLHVGCGENILPKPFENLDITEREGRECWVFLAVERIDNDE